MKKKLTALLAALALSLSLAPAALAAGEAEPNNDYATAAAIRVNETVNGSFTPQGGKGDSDWYKFTLSEPGQVELSFETPANVYFSVEVHAINEKGALERIFLRSFPNVPNAVANSVPNRAVPLCLDAGTYYLELSASSSYEGVYSFRADVTFMGSGSLEYEPNGDYTRATGIDLDTHISGSFTPLASKGDSDWYKFTLDKPGQVALSFETPADVYFSVEIHAVNEKGALERIFLRSFPNLPNAVANSVPNQAVPLCLDAGTYYLELSASSSYEGAYSFRADFTPLTAGWLEYEPNGDYTRASAIDLNATVTGSFTPLASKGDSDWYQLVMPGAGGLTLSFATPADVYFSINLHRINERGALERICNESFPNVSNASAATVNRAMEPIYLAAGTYYLELRASSSYEGAYTFQAASDAAPKPDVPSSWAAEEVSAAIDAGLVPDSLRKNYTGTVTRSQVAGMFILLLEKSSGRDIEALMDRKGVEIDPAAFTDTSDPDVLAANALGIINGIGGGKFAPNGTFTRAQIAAILNRVATVLDVDTSGYTHSFTDVAGHWASSELGWPVHAGIIKGVGGTRFDPDGILTTEQVILMVYRAWEAL